MPSQTDLPSPIEFQILLALAGGDRHGYAILQELERRSEGASRPGPGTLYGAIKRMVQAGWIEGAPSPTDDDPRRTRTYRLTQAGRGVAREQTRRLAELVRVAAERGLIPVQNSLLGAP